MSHEDWLALREGPDHHMVEIPEVILDADDAPSVGGTPLLVVNPNAMGRYRIAEILQVTQKPRPTVKKEGARILTSGAKAANGGGIRRFHRLHDLTSNHPTVPYPQTHHPLRPRTQGSRPKYSKVVKTAR